MQVVTMSTPARKRLMRDFKRLQQDPPAGISGAPQDNNIMLWNAVIFGWVVVWKCIKCVVLHSFGYLCGMELDELFFHFCFVWIAVLMIPLGMEVSCSCFWKPKLTDEITQWDFCLDIFCIYMDLVSSYYLMCQWGLVELVRTIC